MYNKEFELNEEIEDIADPPTKKQKKKGKRSIKKSASGESINNTGKFNKTSKDMSMTNSKVNKNLQDTQNQELGIPKMKTENDLDKDDNQS